MVLVRLAYAADLPTPDDLMRRLGGGSGERAGGRPAISSKQAPREPAPAMHREVPPPAPSPVVETEDPAPAPPLANPESFEDVVALAEREARPEAQARALRAACASCAFAPAISSSIRCQPAPTELAQELMRKLKAWTGRVWIVAAECGGGRRSRLGLSAASARPARSSAFASTLRSSGAAAFPRRAHRRGADHCERGARRAEADEARETEFKEDGTDP